MSDRRFRRKLLLAKVESTYGTDSVPTPELNAILAMVTPPTVYAGPTEQRDVDRGTFGAEIEYHTSLHTEITVRVELAGSGAAGTAPPIGPILRACGLAETIVVSTSVTYDPVSDSHESASLRFYHDGKLFVMLGSRGTWRLYIPARRIPYIEATLWGLHTKASDVAIPTTEDFSGFETPVPVTSNNTPTFNLHGYAGKLESLDIDAGQPLVHRDIVGDQSIEIANRVASGSITIEDPLLSEKDYEAIIEANTLGALNVVHGTTAGNIVTTSGPKVQLMRPATNELHGRIGRQFRANFTPDTGDDEVSIAFT